MEIAGEILKRKECLFRVREAMIRRRFNYKDLTRRINASRGARTNEYSVQTVKNVATGGSQSLNLRRAIEKALGVSVWNTPQATLPDSGKNHAENSSVNRVPMKRTKKNKL